MNDRAAEMQALHQENPHKLSFTELSCIRNDRTLFSQLSFSLLPGSLLIVKGSNGSGKTTLLKILAGLLKPTQGRVEWCGKDITSSTHYRKSLTYIGHKNAIKLECTVLENLQFWAAAYQSELLLPLALHYFGLEEKKHLLCGILSAGWQRKVALSRLLLQPGHVWLLDEPTNFLDAEGITLLKSLVESRVQQGGIVIIASHMIDSSFGSHMLSMEDFAC